MKTLLFILLTPFFSFQAFASLNEIKLNSNIALLMNIETGQILYERNAHAVTSPASITKVATALYTLHEIGDDVKVKIKAGQDCIGSITSEMQKGMNYRHPPHWLVLGGTHMCISKDEELTLEELLYGLMLVSANDAANVIAKYIGGSISQFMTDLNDYLEEIGCKNTKFRNPHGLHLPGHESTAYDMAKITCEAMKHPLFQKIIATEKYFCPSRGNENKAKMFNSNLLIRPGQKYFYPHAIGGKTGIHTEAQSSLIAMASNEGRTLIAVLMQCPEKEDSFNDAKALFEAAFSEHKVEEVYLSKGDQPFSRFVPEAKKNLKTFLKEDVSLSYYPSEKPTIKGEISWFDHLPIKKGDQIATLKLKDQRGTVLVEAPLYAKSKIYPKSSSGRVMFYLMLIVILSLLFVLGSVIYKSGSRS